MAGDGPVLAHCKELARMLVAALHDLETLQPEEMEGLLSAVGARETIPVDETPGRRRRAAGVRSRKGPSAS